MRASLGTDAGNDLADMTAAQLTDGFQDGKFTPREALEAALERHDRVNPRINAVIFVDRQGARAAADRATERWRAGRALSLLDGVPVTVKDNLHVAGMPATWGSRIHADFVPSADEPPIARLRASGAVILGKTNVPEFTLQGYTGNLLFGTTRNPLALDRTPGGSTGGGAAAVAAGIGAIAIGTDGGGSTRRPAAYCGLYGLKPSLGQVPRYGGFPQLLSDFEVIGPMARSTADVAAVLEVMCGYDPSDPRSAASLGTPPSTQGRPARIGFVSKVGSAPVDPQIADAAERTARRFTELGFEVERVAAPYDAGQLAALWTAVAQTGLAWYLSRIEGWRPRVGANALAMADAGASRTAYDYLDALAGIAEMRVAAGIFFTRFDFMLSPTTAALAWPADDAYPETIAEEPVGPRGHAVFSAWANLVGAAAANFPVAMTRDEGGIGMQVTAAAGRELDLLDIMAKWEADSVLSRER
ncbi:MAG: amidase [Methylobacteriaceae bacterium]|nr:amidase [Methylobacteriaceae bacterium]